MTGSSLWNASRPWLIPIAAVLGPVVAVWTYTPSIMDPSRSSFDGAGYPSTLLLGVLGGIVAGYIVRTAGDVVFGTGSFKDSDSAL